ncbi:c-type cytochrome biogenesis protein CcsB [Gryllotalpicola ginsengisoli]|uniref:c-type cytochrome biogenesis protein CcsB n=1 Tax=Gryllotalpicola ginsengisoli TaxID=444608 RepID=UPI0003B39456|nr:c-type cytochrome biogenesis protein CcsB [Gryllotalpicola ginsengisoli]
MTETLSSISEYAIFATMFLYVVAFVCFVLDLAQRSARATAPTAVRSAVERRAAAAASVSSAASPASPSSGAATATLAPPTAATGGGVPADGARTDGAPTTSRALKLAMTVTVVAWAIHLLADITRGIAAGRVPWANMWEFSLTGTLVIVGIFLLVNLRFDLRYVGTFVLGLVCVLLMWAQVFYYVPVAPLPPALQSYWLVIHILVAITGTAFFALGFALAVAHLLQAWRERRQELSLPPVLPFLKSLPGSVELENLTYRVNIIGFIFWTFTLIAGAIWAEKAWGRYWGWDTKEVWTFIIWVIYAGYIHARATRGWRGSRSAWLSIIGFAAVMFNFGVVNVFFHGLHSYSGLTN